MDNNHMKAIFDLPVTKRYIHELFSFVEKFSKQEEKVLEALATDDSETYLKTMVDICMGLKKIYATELAAEWIEYMRVMKKDDTEATKFFVSDFLVQISMLTLDIQSAIFPQKTKAKEEAVKNVLTDRILSIPIEDNLILVVDDLQMQLNTIKAYMKDTEYELNCICAPGDALEYLEKHRPALFLIDIEMPDIDGFILAKKIREMGHTSPIIFMTGNSSEQNLLNAINADAAGFLVKPFSQIQLIKTIDKFMY